MASTTAMINASNYNQIKPNINFLIHKKPPLMMLKDYLLDDLTSSCSSSGFKSFPRRQCCTTVRLLLEIDLNNKKINSKSKQPPHLKRSSSTSVAISALQKASKAVINAVKLLPFPSSSSSSSSVKSSSPVSARNRNRKGVIRLPRSISRRLFKNRKAAGDLRERRDSGKIRDWKMFGEFLDEIEKPSPDQISTAAATVDAAIFSCDGDSSSSSNSNNNSWTDSEFTGHSSCSSESYSSRNGVAAGEKKVQQEKKVSGGGAGEIVGGGGGGGGASITYSVKNTKEWRNGEEKEQFSPVSVLDCPFKDDDEEEDNSSPFQQSLLSVEGSSKQKAKAKMKKLESLAVNLEKQIDHQLTEEAEDEQNKGAEELLKLVKPRTHENQLKSNNNSDNLLLDFFKEKIVEKNGSVEFEEELRVANKWLNVEVEEEEEVFLGWEVKDKRHVYIRDMEKNGNWKNLEGEKEDLVLELEFQLFTSLVNEALFDFI